MSRYRDLQRCPVHECPMVQVQADALPRCLVEWLAERAQYRRVVDFIPRRDIHSVLVMEGGALLPVRWLASRSKKLKPLWNHSDPDLRLHALSMLWLVEIGYLAADTKCQERMMVKFTVSNSSALVLAEVEFDELMNLLLGEEADKYSP